MEEIIKKKFALMKVIGVSKLVVAQSTCILATKDEPFSYNKEQVVRLNNLSSTAAKTRKKTYNATILLFHDKQEELTELQVKYEEGNTTLQEITDLQQATVVPQTALATTNNIETATRKSQRERKRKKLPGESDDEVVNEPEPTTSKGKGKKMNKEEQTASYESVLEKINSAREQMELHLQPKGPKETVMTKHSEASTSFKEVARAPMLNTKANASIPAPVEIETESNEENMQQEVDIAEETMDTQHSKEPNLGALVLTGVPKTAARDRAKHCTNTRKAQERVAKDATEPSVMQNTLPLLTPAGVNKTKQDRITENRPQVPEKHVSNLPVVMIERSELATPDESSSMGSEPDSISDEILEETPVKSRNVAKGKTLAKPAQPLAVSEVMGDASDSEMIANTAIPSISADQTALFRQWTLKRERLKQQMALVDKEFGIESNSNESDSDSIDFAQTNEDGKYKKDETGIVLSAWPIKNSFSERCFREASSCQQFINRMMSGLFTNEYLASHTRTSSKRRNFNEKKKPMDSAHVEEIMDVARKHYGHGTPANLRDSKIADCITKKLNNYR